MEEAEKGELFRQNNGGNSIGFDIPTFRSKGSAGNNNTKLARIMAAYDLAMGILGWEHDLSNIVTEYQASVDAKYHDDYVKIAVADEIVRKRRIRYSPELMGRNDDGQQ